MGRLGPVTETMQAAIALAQDHGNKLHRHPGGYWCGNETGPRGLDFGTNTVHGLVLRGVAHYSKHRQHRRGGGEFPIEITLNAGWRV